METVVVDGDVHCGRDKRESYSDWNDIKSIWLRNKEAGGSRDRQWVERTWSSGIVSGSNCPEIEGRQ